LEDRRNVGVSSCNFGDGTDQSVQSLMFMMMMMMMTSVLCYSASRRCHKSDPMYRVGWYSEMSLGLVPGGVRLKSLPRNSIVTDVIHPFPQSF